MGGRDIKSSTADSFSLSKSFRPVITGSDTIRLENSLKSELGLLSQPYLRFTKVE